MHEPCDTTPPSLPDATFACASASAPRTSLFIDADNQPAVLAEPLVKLLACLGRPLSEVTIAGNKSGNRVSEWEAQLRALTPQAEVHAHYEAIRRQSADARLLFELARIFQAQPDPQHSILILSRDDLLLAAAELLQGQGHTVVVTFSSSSPPLNTAIAPPVLLIPVPPPGEKPPSPPSAAPPAATLPHPTPTTVPPSAPASVSPPQATPTTLSTVEAHLVTDAINAIRRAMPNNQNVGYPASSVGQLLMKMGYDKTMRDKIRKAIPNLRTEVVNKETRYFF